VGPLSGLTQQRARYREALQVLADPGKTTLVLVTRPDAGALQEAGRASSELAAIGLRNQVLMVNGVHPGLEDADDRVGRAFVARQREALGLMAPALAQLPRESIPLMGRPPVGLEGLRSLLQPEAPDRHRPASLGEGLAEQYELGLARLVEEVTHRGRGLVMTMGKGGVGKTTVAASIAVAIARQGVPVVLSTTDPAAHLISVLGSESDLPAQLSVERIDPAAATAAYTAEVLEGAGAGLEQAARDVLVEDLRSPCTEEIAVFREFAATVARAQEQVVVLDTAPSGHTLLLLDAARSFQREVSRQSAEVPPEVEALLDRLSDPEFTRIVVVTLAEPTPVHEAQALQEDLLRAGIQPLAWVVNQSLLATGTEDTLLAALAAHERRWINEAARIGGRVMVVGWQPAPPLGADGLLALVGSAPAAALAG
jgi:arsenite-transporting ATPase